MYIEPNTTLQLYKNLKLNSDYANTMWFENISAQNNFFNSRPTTDTIVLNNHSYQRKDIGVIKVQLTISQAFDLTYLRFINSSFENKWFYAFINKVEYVNNTTVYIYYTLDLIQTYMFNWDLHQCLIERQHSVTDVAGDNLEIEGLEIGDAICDGIADDYSLAWGDITSCTAIICCANNPLVEDFSSANKKQGYISGLVSGLWILYYDLNGHLDDFLDDINGLAQYADTVVSITILPTAYISKTSSVGGRGVIISKPSSLNGYTPVNKKLLTYPYCFLNVYNDQGEEIDLRYELFSTNNCTFNIDVVTSCTPEAITHPNYYDSQTNNIYYAISTGGFPQVSFQSDAFKAWYAMNYDQIALNKEVANREYNIASAGNALGKTQNNINTATTLATSGVNIIGKSLSGNFGGAINTGINAVNAGLTGAINNEKINLAQSSAQLDLYKVNQGANIQESVARKRPNTAKAGSTSLMCAITKKGFYYQKMSIRAHFARKVDKYFSMFGYAQNKVGVPNLHARTQFTYIKTSGCSVSGNIPQDDKETINAIFDRGIRFWVNYANFENYDVTNTII